VTDNNETPATPATKPVVLYTSIMQHGAARALMESAAVLLAKADRFQAVPSDTDAELMGEFRARLNQTIKDLDSKRLEATEEHRKLVAKINAEVNVRLEPMGEVLKRTDKLLKDYRQKKADEQAAALRAKQEEEARVAREKAEAEQRAREANEAAQRAAQEAEAARLALAAAATPEAQAEAQKKLEEAKATQESSINTAAQQAATAVQLEQRADVLAGMVIPTAPPKTISGSFGSTSTQKDNWKWELIDTEAQPAAVSITLVPQEYLVEPVARINKSVMNAKAKSVKKESTTAVPGIRIYNDPFEQSRAGR
jgi:hypothetical protein